MLRVSPFEVAGGHVERDRRPPPRIDGDAKLDEPIARSSNDQHGGRVVVPALRQEPQGCTPATAAHIDRHREVHLLMWMREPGSIQGFVNWRLTIGGGCSQSIRGHCGLRPEIHGCAIDLRELGHQVQGADGRG